MLGRKNFCRRYINRLTNFFCKFNIKLITSLGDINGAIRKSLGFLG